MANTLITPTTVAPMALAALYETTAMVPLVHRDYDTIFATQKIGNTVNVRKPITFTANEFDRATGIVLQDATETTIPVVLNKIADVSFALTTEEMTLTVEQFEARFLTPAMEAIAQKIDRSLVALSADVTQVVGTDAVSGTTPPGERVKTARWQQPEVLIDAGAVLDRKSAPASERNTVIGPTTKSWWLDSQIVKHAEKSGSTEALRGGSIGKNLFGFDAYMSQNIAQPPASPTTGQPTTEVNLAFHRSAFVLASAPLEIPPGTNAAVQTYEGLSIRVVSDYDIIHKKTIFSVDMLYGTKTMDANRACLVRGALAS